MEGGSSEEQVRDAKVALEAGKDQVDSNNSNQQSAGRNDEVVDAVGAGAEQVIKRPRKQVAVKASSSTDTRGTKITRLIKKGKVYKVVTEYLNKLAGYLQRLLEVLPMEIITVILRCLSVKDLLCLSNANKAFQLFLNASSGTFTIWRDVFIQDGFAALITEESTISDLIRWATLINSTTCQLFLLVCRRIIIRF